MSCYYSIGDIRKELGALKMGDVKFINTSGSTWFKDGEIWKKISRLTSSLFAGTLLSFWVLQKYQLNHESQESLHVFAD